MIHIFDDALFLQNGNSIGDVYGLHISLYWLMGFPYGLQSSPITQVI